MADGLALPEAMQFLDDGYSGATLVRPALERKYAYQVLLVDACRRAGVEVIFLNRALGQSPEDDLLLQVQGMIAAYERAKIIERHRRGKRHAARAGAVHVLRGAPYGYRSISKYEGGGQARYEIVPDEARLVRHVFDWVGRDRLTIGEVCRRLTHAGEVTRTGKTVWDRSVVWGMLKHPAYQGTGAFGKTHQEPLRPRLRPQRGRLHGGRAAGGVVPSSRAGSRGARGLCCCPGAIAGQSTPRPAIAPRCVVCAPRLGAVSARRLCLRWETAQPQRPERPTPHVRLLPLPGHGRVPLWRRAHLSEYAGADGSLGRGRLGGSLYVAGASRAARGGISAPVPTRHAHTAPRPRHHRGAPWQAAARSGALDRQLRRGPH